MTDLAFAVPRTALLKTVVDMQNRGQVAEALELLRTPAAASPGDGEVAHIMAILAHRLGRTDDALRWNAGAMRTEGQHRAAAFRNQAEMMRAAIAGKEGPAAHMAIQAALRAAQDLAAFHGGFKSAEVVHTYALTLAACGRYAEARGLLEAQASRFGDQPDLRFLLAELCLRAGNWKRGWQFYSDRFRIRSAKPYIPDAVRELAGARAREWDGAAGLDDGHLTIMCDQGFGDIIMFSRFLPALLRHAYEKGVREAQIGAPGDMHPWVRRAASMATDGLDGDPLVVRLFDRWTEADALRAYVALSSAPALLAVDHPSAGTWYRDWAAAWSPGRYFGDTEGIERAAPGLLQDPNVARIGLVWAGRPDHPNDGNRSMPLAALLAAAEVAFPSTARVVFFSLQKGDAAAQIGTRPFPYPLIDLGPHLTTLERTVGAMRNMHAVVTVDTAMAHLAATIGTPVYVALPHAAEWRWGDLPDDGRLMQGCAAWYPEASHGNVWLARRKADDCWPDVAERVFAHLMHAYVPAFTLSEAPT